MNTDKILERLSELKNEFRCREEDISFLSDEDYDYLEEIDSEVTNPRRDYIGNKTYIKNKFDNRYFYVETCGNDMYMELRSYGEVESKEVTSIEWIAK